MPYLVGIAFPSAGHPDPIRGYAIPGCAGRDTTSYSLISDVVCGGCSATLIKASIL